MNILIAYSSKYGFTKACTEKLASLLNDNVVLVDLDKETSELAKYDKIIIGGSVYGGKVRKSVSKFCKSNLQELDSKKIGLFICGMMEGEKAEKQLNASFPKSLLDKAVAKENFGAGFDFTKMNSMESIIIKKAAGVDKNQSHFLKKNIKQFADQMNNAG